MNLSRQRFNNLWEKPRELATCCLTGFIGLYKPKQARQDRVKKNLGNHNVALAHIFFIAEPLGLAP